MSDSHADVVLERLVAATHETDLPENVNTQCGWQAVERFGLTTERTDERHELILDSHKACLTLWLTYLALRHLVFVAQAGCCVVDTSNAVEVTFWAADEQLAVHTLAAIVGTDTVVVFGEPVIENFWIHFGY